MILVEVKKAIKNVKLDKSSSGDIPANIIKQCDICFQVLTKTVSINLWLAESLHNRWFENISPVYKAKDPLDKVSFPILIDFSVACDCIP